MPLDPDIRQETYPYFLQEAPELLQALEQGLLDLQDGCSINQINALMRTTHTLKGAAASVGLETIATIAHSLEDIFKGLCKPDVTIDPDVVALLFEGYDCLARPLKAEITGSSVNTAEVLDRSAAIFAQLEARLGDCFNQDDYLPTSEELGFDVTQSMFEVGVTQRLDDLAQTIAQHPENVAATLQTHAEVFFGLAESLGLQGFGAIAAITLTALEQHPDQTLTIAQLALADLQAGCAAVLAGDRTQGGQPSAALQQFVEMPASTSPVSPEVLQPDWLTEFDIAFAQELEQPDQIGEPSPESATASKATLTELALADWQENVEPFTEATIEPLTETITNPVPEPVTNTVTAESDIAPINYHEIEISHPEAHSASEQTLTEAPEPTVSISLSEAPVVSLSEALVGQEGTAVNEATHSSVSDHPAVESAATAAIAPPDPDQPALSQKTHDHKHRGLCRVFQWIRDAILVQAGLHPDEQSDQTSPEDSSTATLQNSADPALTVVALEKAVQESTSAESQPEQSPESLLEKVWAPIVIENPPTEPEEAIASSLSPVSTANLATIPNPIVSTHEPHFTAQSLEDAPQLSEATSITASRTPGATSTARKKPLRANQVRVNVEHLDQLNYSIGELLTQQNRQSLQNERLQAEVKTLLKRLNQHQQMLNQLQDQGDHQSSKLLSSQQELTPEQPSGQQPSGQQKLSERQSATALQTALPAFGDRFDALELSYYSDSHLLVQSLLDDTVQLTEAAEAIDLFAQQSSQILEKQQRLLSGTRDALMQARMLPLGEVFNRFPPVLQQLETLHGKRVSLALHGTEVMADKAIAEKLYDPLLHLIRNAFDHAIEPVAIRRQQGKPEIGQIEINAYHQGKYLIIEVRDDGKGLDYEQIRQRLVERQLVSPQQAETLTQSQLIDFLFEPGFSTATHVNTLSGRGVGLDVVREQILGLQGLVSVQSMMNQGATFMLQIPLSLAIAKLLVCQAGTETYALTTDAIEQILIPMPEDIRERQGRKILHWRKGTHSQLIPLHSVAKLFNYNSSVVSCLPSQPASAAAPRLSHVILIRHQGELVGLEVDQLIGEQELVIRPLGSRLESPSYVQGASVLADGRLTLVVDGGALLQQVLHQPLAPRPANPSENSSMAVQAPLQTTATLIPNSNAEDWESEKKILIVEDSITVRQTLTLTLQKAGYQVLQAKDGQEAIEQLQQQEDVQLVFCDLEMPRMNGFEFLKQRQQSQALASIPVIVLTSRSGDKHRLLALELGATAYITKPYIEHKLLAMVADLFEIQKIEVTAD